ncbi:Prefoldin subunit 4 [Caligus rogercresseyi]|uniref:Prefoldin subunit 4 n=1 Tax=Caligus rogercresseyi TaxID=217165 RepID=A0A7T8KHR4_CALRO|nr:Prefoldin subunit 4 [Caligus rogercresseyi]
MTNPSSILPNISHRYKETHISLDDQQKINKFARLNSRLEDLKEELSGKTSEITTLEDASLDITMLDEEEDGLVPFQWERFSSP